MVWPPPIEQRLFDAAEDSGGPHGRALSINVIGNWGLMQAI